MLRPPNNIEAGISHVDTPYYVVMTLCTFRCIMKIIYIDADEDEVQVQVEVVISISISI